MIHNKNIQIIMISLILMGCDAIQSSNESQREARTMIIGGVPVHDKDYKRPDNHQSLSKSNNQTQQ